MSLLIFEHGAEQIVICTDTLATTDDGTPAMFTTKCYVLPHLRMVMAVTGLATLGHAWNNALVSRMIVRDIDMLDKHVPAYLTQLQQEMAEEVGAADQPDFGIVLGTTTTIYHFGWSPTDDALVRYVYRSNLGFQSERYPADDGFGIKPWPEGEWEPPQSIDETIALAKKVRDEQDARPDGLHIGGHLILTYVQREAIITSLPVYTWPDSDAMWDQMCERLADLKRQESTET